MHLRTLRSRGVLGRAVVIAALCFTALVSWSEFAPVEAGDDNFELRIDFTIREWLKRSPPVHPRLKILVLDDPTVSFLQAGDLSLDEWAELLEALAAQKPERIVIDKLFDLPRDRSQVPGFVARMEKLQVPVVTGAFVTPRHIQGRPELSLDAPWNDVRNLSGEAAADDLLGAPTSAGRFAYGSHPTLQRGLRYNGHLGYRGIGRVLAIERLDARLILPHVAFLPTSQLGLEDGYLVAGGRRVPLLHGLIQVNIASLTDLAGRSYRMKDVIARARQRLPIPIVRESDVVLILPGMYTGNADWVMTPVGQIAGGYVLASILNSVLTGDWLRTIDVKIPLLAAAVLLGFAFGLLLFGRALWLATTGTVVAICLAGLSCFVYAGLVVPWILPAAAFFATSMTIFTERSRAERGHRLRIEAELETAGLVQRAFFPRGAPQPGTPRVIGHCRPATQCGGDWWWHFSPAPSVEVVLIGDVMGHGTPAALVTSALYSAVSTMIALEKSTPGVELSPGRILQTLNHMLFESLRGERIVTMFIGCFDLSAGKLTYANASHPFPLAFRDGAKTDINFRRPGSMLGLEAKGTFPEATIPLHPGDKFVLYTDGIIECATATGQPLGKRGFATLATRHAPLDAPAMAQALAQDLFTTLGAADLADDCTFVIIEIPPLIGDVRLSQT